jgi:hypothetical protein
MEILAHERTKTMHICKVWRVVLYGIHPFASIYILLCLYIHVYTGIEIYADSYACLYIYIYIYYIYIFDIDISVICKTAR